MADWKSIETFDYRHPIWVISYEITFPEQPGKVWFDTHGWYDTEGEALDVLNHFPKPNTYRVHKTHHHRVTKKSD